MRRGKNKRFKIIGVTQNIPSLRTWNIFYPSRRLGILSDASRHIIKGGKQPLYLITRQVYLTNGLMIYNTTC